MEVQIVVNGDITLVIEPSDEAEEKLLERLTNQDNEISLIRSGVSILGKSISKGVVIGKKKAQSATDTEESRDNDQEQTNEESEE